MLPKELRLLSHQIRTVLKTGFFLSDQGIQLKFIPDRNNSPHFAVLVTSKSLKSSVKRNRIKRLVRISIVKNIEALPYSIHGVFFTKNISEDITQETVDALIISLFRKIR